MVKISLQFIGYVYAILFMGVSQEYEDKLLAQSDLDTLIQTGQYELAQAAIAQKKSAGKINDKTARLYEFKNTYELGDAAALERFADGVMGTDAQPQELVFYIYGLKKKGRKKSTQKIYEKSKALLAKYKPTTDTDSCLYFNIVVMTENIYQNHQDELKYVAPLDSIPYYCGDETMQDFLRYHWDDGNLMYQYSEAFQRFLDKDNLWSKPEMIYIDE